jgi:hypothetical protein
VTTGTHDADQHRQRVLRIFLDDSGALRTMPAKRSKRLVVLEHVAQVFEPGARYPEPEVNAKLEAFYPDVAALRRYLVDEGLLERTPGVYWRAAETPGR